jgi:hypothetical protein
LQKLNDLQAAEIQKQGLGRKDVNQTANEKAALADDFRTSI